jgi:PAS domain S-box-containing protein
MSTHRKAVSLKFDRHDFSATELLAGVFVLFGLHLTTYHNYLLFHNLVEIFSVIIAMTIFVIALNCWKSIQNQYVIFIGIAYLFIGFLDILHTLSYKGMPIFTDYDYYAPQFWIAARLMESVSMLLAFSVLGAKKRLSKPLLLTSYFLASIAFISTILYFKTFPVCFVAGTGLTPFKKIMEYLICAILLASMAMLYRRRHFFDPRIYRLIGWSILLMIAMELCFTLYVSNSMSDAINETGHLIKIVAFFLIYKALVVTGLTDPINLLFRNLKISEENLLEAQQLARLGRWEWLPDTNQWLFSDEILHFCALSGNASPTFNGVLAALQAQDQKALQQAMQGLHDSGIAFDLKICRIGCGETKFAQIRGRALHDEHAKTNRLVGTWQDISDEHRLQEALAIVKDKEKYELLMQTSGDGIHLIDIDGNVIEVNDMFCKMLGYSRDELLRMNVSQWDAQFDPEKIQAKLDACFQIANLFETRHRCKDGAIIDVEINAKAINYAGQTVLWNASRDITERKLAEQEMKRSNAELEQFSYAVSHDMRQPLRMISSYLQLLEIGLAGQLDQEKRSYFNFAVEGAKRIDQMLIDLLEYSRIGRMGAPSEWILSREVLEDALHFLSPAIVEAQAELEITGDWPRIYANRDEVLRLMQNLIGNAAKYRIEGRTPKITVSSNVVSHEWQLCVADNGVGIIPDQIKRLFKLFQRLQKRETYAGTGIGLALCRKIVEHHKGRIWVESQGAELGCQFYAALPAPQTLPSAISETGRPGKL